MDQASQLKLAVDQIVGLAEQIITLSSAILVLSMTFAKDVLKVPSHKDRVLMQAAWVGYLLAIVAGIWVRMATAGTLLKGTPIGEFNMWLPAAIQIVVFLTATALFLVLAIRGLARAPSQTGNPPELNL